MLCQRIGREPIGTIGLGIASEYSRRRRPRPPQNTTTFMRPVSRPPASFEDPYLGDRHEEPSVPLAGVLELVADLVRQVPGQDPDRVRTGLREALRRLNGDVRPRRDAAVLA